MGDEILTKADSRPLTEQDRTRIKKAHFLEIWKRTRGVISATCDKVEISRETFYDWKRNDPDFAAAVQKVEAVRNQDVEDVLMGLIHLAKDGPSVRYYLDRRDPRYKPRSAHEFIPTSGDKPLEQVLREAAIRRLNKKNGITDDVQRIGNTGGDIDGGQPGADRELSEDTQ